jgi:nucleoside 2-deoxyribosyltransferase
LFYSGGSQVGALVAQVCAKRELRCLVPQADREPASLRWDQLRESAVAVFDFTGYKRAASSEQASPIAAVAYELGIALALGRAAVVVATDGQELPFDLDIEPICLNNDDSDVANLSAAFDRALYGLQRGAAGSSVKSSVKYLRERFAGHPSPHVRMSLETLDDAAMRDPIKARHLIASTSGFLGAEALQILLPAWPGQYPDTSSKRCFHVTAFGPTWANSTRRLVGDACGSQIEYIRGDGVLAPDILRSIWEEICRATHVVVDLTGLNANVVLELGMAHALGRNVLLISQDQQVERYFRAIAKHRIHPYTLKGSDTPGLQATLQRFFT